MPPNLLFVDTTAWYAVLDRKDRNHSAAVRFVEESRVPFVTSTYILDETITLVNAHLGHAVAERFGHPASAFAFDAHFAQYGRFVRLPLT